MPKLPFRVKSYAHPKYKFIVRAKIDGRWIRRYFQTEAEANGFAAEQNAAAAAGSQQRPGWLVADQLPMTAAPGSPDAVLVIGMHRSGTSALAGALEQLGIDFGSRLAPPSDFNQRGYWEHQDIIALHDQLLQDIGSSWDDERALPDNWTNRPEAVKTATYLESILRRDFGSSQLFGVKDPRISRLMPMWHKVLMRMNVRPHFVIIVRHPHEVAGSLARRDGFEPSKSYLLWLRYTLEAEVATRGQSRAFVSFEALLGNPVDEIRHLQKQLGLPWRDPATISEEIRAFLEPSLRHHRTSEAAPSALPAIVQGLYERISQSTSVGEPDLAPIHELFNQAADVFAPRITSAEAEIAAAKRIVQTATGETSQRSPLVRMQLYLPTADGYSEAGTVTRYFPSDSWQTIQINLEGRGFDTNGQLRIDPASFPAVVEVSHLAVTAQLGDEAVWDSSDGGSWDDLVVAGTAQRVRDAKSLRLLSLGADPQLLLPAFPRAAQHSALRLEITIKVDASVDAIGRAVTDIGERGASHSAVNEPWIVVSAKDSPAGDVAVARRQAIHCGIRQHFLFERIEQLTHASPCELRIQLLNHSGTFKISQIRISRGLDENVLYEAHLRSQFSALTFSPGVRVENGGEGLVLFIVGSPAEIFLPSVDLKPTACRLEILAESNSASPELIAQHIRALDDAAALELTRDELGTQAVRLSEELSRLRDELQQGQTLLKQSLERGQLAVKELDTSKREILRLEQALTDSLASKAQETGSLRSALGASTEELAASQREISRLQESITEDKALKAREIASLSSLVTAANQELATSQSELVRIKQTTAESEAKTRYDIEHLTKAIGATNQELSARTAELDRTRFATAAVESRFAAARDEVLRLVNVTVPVALTALRAAKDQVERSTAASGFRKLRLLLKDTSARHKTLISEIKSARRQLTQVCKRLEIIAFGAKGNTSHAESEKLTQLERLSRLFDRLWYVETYPDVAQSALSPLEHYLQYGASEGRDPNPLFFTRWYLSENPDVASEEWNPLDHFLQHGSDEGRRPNPLFDPLWYTAQHPDISEQGYNPLEHYWKLGAALQYDPHPLFASAWYLDVNKDVAAAGLNPLAHYLRAGAAEGRDPHPLFNTEFYLRERSAKAAAHRQTGAETPSRAERRLPYSSAPAKSRTYAFTSICLNYIPKAVALATTLKRHHPDIHFCLLVNEPVPSGLLDEFTVFDEVVSVEDLDIPNKRGWIFGQTVVELSTAVKGFFMVELLERADCGAAFYFDPDIVIIDKLTPLMEALESASILLTPHLTEPETTKEAVMDNEIAALKHGVYNLGFLALRSSSEGKRFAHWWRDRLREFCRADIPAGLFTDQRWVDLAPAFFEDIQIIRHPGCNAATWNFTHRRIEGDFTRGFTVNGEPLIFYHFSGFDSGAQGAMLNKYGSDMAAAHLLREWYISETEGPQHSRFSNIAWAYGTFDNGEPIALGQRALYRDREDLQSAFPNPFSSTNPGASYYHWYQSEVLGRRDEIEFSENPLVAFLTSDADTNPNPLFDSGWYRRRYPDVARSGANPLMHYVLWGAAEGRQPTPGFDVTYYLEQLSPEERGNNALIHYLHSGRERGLRLSPLFDPKIDETERSVLLRWANGKKPLILLVSHYGGGGTERHVRELVAAAGDGARFLQLVPKRDGTVVLSPAGCGLHVSLRFDPAQQFDALIELLRDCAVQRLHIHHALGNEHYLRNLVDELCTPFDFTAHDYYVLAPSPHLIGTDSKFVGENLHAAEKELLAMSISPHPPSSLAVWQVAHRWLIDKAERVITPSRDVALRFARHFPDRDFVIAAHPEKLRVTEPKAPPLRVDESLRIVVLGELPAHKGHGTVAACAQIARRYNDPLEFSLVGDPLPNGDDLLAAGVWVSGRYREENVCDLVAARRPHLLWYPALCPETYSYTLSIGLQTGLPVVISNLGALPERVTGRQWTWACDWDLHPVEWIEFFLRIRRDYFAPQIRPQVIAATKSQPNVSFYSSAYIKPRAETTRAASNKGSERSALKSTLSGAVL